jgi:hypothetical protein
MRRGMSLRAVAPLSLVSNQVTTLRSGGVLRPREQLTLEPFEMDVTVIRGQHHGTPDTRAMAAMSAMRVAWMMAHARAVHRTGPPVGSPSLQP